MAQINSYGRPSFQRQKQIVIILAFVLSALIVPFYFLTAQGSAQALGLRFAETLGFGLLTLAWCHYDSAERNRPLGGGFRALLVLLGIFGLLIYLLKTRGAKNGLLAIGVVVLLFFGTNIVSTLTERVFSTITGLQ